jgi:hypothetical protein
MANGIPPDGSVIVTADATLWTADETQWPSADGGILGNIVYAEIVEPVQTVVTADELQPTADQVGIVTADGGIISGAADALDAEYVVDVVEAAFADEVADAAVNGGIAFGDIVEPADAEDLLDAIVEAAGAEIGGGGPPPEQRPFPVEGVGYGILPELEGEARGVVYVVGTGAGTFGELTGAASGTISAAGSADAQVALRGAAIGQRGVCATATGMLEPITAWAPGAAITHGIGAGMIGKPRGVAMGQHDDDEAAVMAFLLAA